MIKQFYLNQWLNSNKNYHFVSEWSNGNEGVLQMPQSSHCLRDEVGMLYSFSQLDWKKIIRKCQK